MPNLGHYALNVITTKIYLEIIPFGSEFGKAIAEPPWPVDTEFIATFADPPGVVTVVDFGALRPPGVVVDFGALRPDDGATVLSSEVVLS
jgi:hypothetical protein